MSVEIPAEFGGSGSSFFSSVIVIEEIAKIDMSLSVMVDVQNTLVNQLVVKLGTDEQRKKYLPLLCANTVTSAYLYHCLYSALTW